MNHFSGIIIVMGVAGCGKSTLGRALADALECQFHEGDAFHPAENVAKMSGGIPLTDEDRWPWLDRLRREVITTLPPASIAVLACSALKRAYRHSLRSSGVPCFFIHIVGSYQEILERIHARKGHFMKSNMLESQFSALEDLDLQIEKGVEIPFKASSQTQLNKALRAIKGISEV